MGTTEQGPTITRAGRAAVVLSAACVLLPLVLAAVFGGILKAINPDGVDVTNGLAYLREILIVGWITVGVIVVAALVIDLLVLRRDRAGGRLALVVWGVQVVLGVAFALASAFLNAGG